MTTTSRIALPLLLLAALAGCRSHVITVNLTNSSAAPIHTVQVDYPNATFGKDTLAPGETFSYAIKPLDKGKLKIQFTDSTGASHANEVVSLEPNDEGRIDVKFSQAKADIGLDLLRSGQKIILPSNR